MGSADPPGNMDEKLNSENMLKEQFSEWGVDDAIMLTRYLFRYTSECTIA